MRVRIGKKWVNVDVRARDCPTRDCFALGFDKGSFTPGVGYTSYYESGPRSVCWTRYIRGCPIHSVCPDCRTLSTYAPGAQCEWGSCGGITVARVTEAP